MLVNAEERNKQFTGVKAVITGKPGIGKTTLLTHLDPRHTLFIDLEAGDLAVGDFKGNTLQPRTWAQCQAIACLAGGFNPAIQNPKAKYSQAHYDVCSEQMADVKEAIEKSKTLFVDSITVAARLALLAAQQNPQNFTKTGALDTRGCYGQIGRELMEWLIQLQHTRNKNVIFCSVLDEYQDDLGQPVYALQLEGQKIYRELPGIVDQVITYAFVDEVDKDGHKSRSRKFICTTDNDFGYPAKDRSGKLQTYEEPNLKQLLTKLLPTQTKEKKNA